MSTEWPNAPRLSAALERTAAEVRTDPVVQARLRELLWDADANAMVPIETDSSPAEPLHRWAPFAAVAALLVAVTFGALLVSGRDLQLDQVRSAASAPPPAATSVPWPAATPRELPAQAPAPIALPTLAEGDHCGRPLGDSEAYLLETPLETAVLKMEVGVSGRGPNQPELIVVGTETWQATATQLPFETSLSSTRKGVYYVPNVFDVSVAEDVRRALFSSTCGAALYLLALGDGYDPATAMACGRSFGQGFNGFGFVDPGPPPGGCTLSQPVIIISPEPLATRSEWERQQGCSDPTMTADGEGNVITTYGTCDNTLIHVDTVAPDPMAATIDGVPASEFLARVTGIAK